jgi:transcription elongation factor Elf1
VFLQGPSPPDYLREVGSGPTLIDLSYGVGTRGGDLSETFVDCPACGEPFALEVDTTAEEQSHFVSCPECGRSLEVFVRCHGGAVQSVSASVD